MQEEKQNKITSWQEKLQALDQVPGEEKHDTNEAWNKLQQRLQPKSRRKGAWFWLAAACILIILMVPWVITKTDGTVEKPNAENKIQPAVTPMLPEQTPTIIVSNNLKYKTNPSGKNNNTQLKSRHTINNTLVQSSSIPVTNENTANKDEVVITPNITAKPDSFITSNVKNNTKQKLRVVHLNELETTPALNPGEMVTSPSQHSNKFKINFLHSSQSNGANSSNTDDESSLKIFINN